MRSVNLTDLPDDLKAKLYAAFGIQVLYRAHKRQATISATITDATPGIIAALDKRAAADDTACGNLASDPIRALTTPSNSWGPWIRGTDTDNSKTWQGCSY